MPGVAASLQNWGQFRFNIFSWSPAIILISLLQCSVKESLAVHGSIAPSIVCLMLHLCIDPTFAPKIFSQGFADAFREIGVDADIVSLGSARMSEFWAKQKWMRSKARTAATIWNTFFEFPKSAAHISKGDIAIVYETNSIVSRVADAKFHREAKAKGAKIVSLLPDYWPCAHPFVKEAFRLRAELADAVACVTPQLACGIGEIVKNKPVIVLEEPIDTGAFVDVARIPGHPQGPIVVWSGPPHKAESEISAMLSAMKALPSSPPFRLRVVTGSSCPRFKIDRPFEWRPFFGLSYGEQFSDAEIAFACYGHREWDKYKGNYKVKTYMAAGCATVTDDSGYNRNLVRHGESGFLVPDSRAMAASIVQLIQDPEKRLHLRRAAQNACRSRFGYKPCAMNWAGTLQKIGL